MTAAEKDPVMDKNIIQFLDGSRNRIFGRPSIFQTGLGGRLGFASWALGIAEFGGACKVVEHDILHVVGSDFTSAAGFGSAMFSELHQQVKSSIYELASSHKSIVNSICFLWSPNIHPRVSDSTCRLSRTQ